MKRLLFAATCVLLGCTDSLGPAEGIAVVAATEPASIRAGQAMHVAISVHNDGDEARELDMSSCVPNFEILDAFGNVVGPGPRVCTLEFRAPVQIAPYSVLNSTEQWTGESTETTPTSGAPIYVAPGSYILRPRVRVVGGGWVYGQLLAVTVVP